VAPVQGSGPAVAVAARDRRHPTERGGVQRPGLEPPVPAAPSPGAASGPERSIRLEPLRITVVRDEQGREQVVAYDARALLDRGNEALLAGRHDEALRAYDELLEVFPDSQLSPLAMFNAGLAHEGKAEYDRAIARYRRIAERGPVAAEAIDAQMRLAALQAELERWTAAAEALRRMTAEWSLPDADRVEALARLGYVLIELRDYTGAEAALQEAITTAARTRDAADTDEVGTDYYAAMAHYYLGEVPRRQFQAIPLRLPDAQMERDLEAKSELVITAHKRYARAIETGNLYWATAAGHQLAVMQKEFWDAIVTAPVPPHLSPRAARIYVAEVHRHARQFLEKALRIHTRNVELAETHRVSTPWSEASRQRTSEIAAILARETGGELVVPDRTGSVETPDPAHAISPDRYVPGRMDL
jgi:tetratricopeptide (TPR) repeat protein